MDKLNFYNKQYLCYCEENSNHSKRVSIFTEILLFELMQKGLCRNLKEDDIILCSSTAKLHDIGKIGVEKTLLLKPDKLTLDEYKIVQKHTLLGAEIIWDMFDVISKPKLFYNAFNVALYHHEKWNGTGYPFGLKGKKIPFIARVVSVADVYDAIRSKRIYKPPISHNDAVQIITNESGKSFEPKLVRCFVNVHKKIESAYENFYENEADNIDNSYSQSFLDKLKTI